MRDHINPAYAHRYSRPIHWTVPINRLDDGDNPETTRRIARYYRAKRKPPRRDHGWAIVAAALVIVLTVVVLQRVW